MATKIYGASDDLVEFEGDIYGEIGCYGTDESERGIIVTCNDGTKLEVKYGKNNEAIWGITVLKEGTLFNRKEECESADADGEIYSDIIYLNDGAKSAKYSYKEEKNIKVE